MPKKPFIGKLPPDFAKALRTRPAVANMFKSLPPSHQRRYVEWINAAKLVETKRKRVTASIKMIAAKTK